LLYRRDIAVPTKVISLCHELQIVCGNPLLSASTLAGAGTRHPATTLGTFTADPGTVFHAYLFAAPGTGIADFGADPAELAAKSRSAQH